MMVGREVAWRCASLALGAIEVVAEASALVLFSTPRSFAIKALYFVIVLMAVMRCALPFAFFILVMLHCREYIHPGSFFTVLASLPFVAALIAALASPWVHAFFQIDFDTHELLLNDLAYASLAYTLFYAVISIAVTCRGLAGRRLCDAIGRRGCDLFVQ